MDFLRLNSELCTLSACVWLFGISLFWRHLHWSVLLTIVSARVLIPFLYFLSGPDGTWTIQDDETYFANAQILLMQGYHFFDLIFNPEARELAAELSGGMHYGYTVFNALTLSIFGEEYFVPVLFNLALSFLCARFAWALAREWGFAEKSKTLVLIFFLVHWDFVAWSSFLNVKDVLVMSMTTLALLALTRFVKSASLLNLSLLLVLCMIFVFVRYYVPVLLAATLLLSVCIFRPGWWTFLALPVVGGLFLFFLPDQGPVIWEYLFWQHAVAGGLHFLLTPVPWQLSEEYGFLLCAAPLHWIAFPFTCIGAAVLWNSKSSLTRIGIFYFFLTLIFYALIPELSGPRHRVQIAPLLAIFQCAGLFWIFQPHFLKTENKE
jgi:hypothetical protein